MIGLVQLANLCVVVLKQVVCSYNSDNSEVSALVSGHRTTESWSKLSITSSVFVALV